MNEKKLSKVINGLVGTYHYLTSGPGAMEPPEMVECIDAAIKILSDMSLWTPVSEELPEEKINPNTHDFEYVLCATVFGDVRSFKFGTRIGEKQPHFWNGAGYADAYITHWMPMPKFLKGEENVD